MQKDFHYYCIAVIALAAGYSPKEAQTIAYASQYVDDETIDTPLIGKDKNTIFEPIRTTYKGIEYILALQRTGQKEVLVSFHFIPKAPFMTDQDSLYQTVKNSEFARSIVKDALKSEGDIRLHRIGIALHTFADTWAHQGFSGIHDSKINEVDKLKTIVKYGNQFSSQLFDVLDINTGHISALSIPDYPYEIWERNGEPPQTNQEEFITASKEIFSLLLDDKEKDGASKEELRRNWEREIIPKINALFAFRDSDEENRCENWKNAITDLQPLLKKDISSLLDYNKDDWRNVALSIHIMSLNEALGTTRAIQAKSSIVRKRIVTDWDKIDSIMNDTYSQRRTGKGVVKGRTLSLDMRKGFEALTLKPDYENTDWCRFQKAAKQHRSLVMAGIPK